MRIPSDLEDGYRRFRQERFVTEAERYKTLAKGQQPETMIIACADSRVDPASIFSAAPGELFVVRNVAALVPPYEETGTYHGTSAALEFAVNDLKVVNIVVMGHGMCGGIAAALAVAEHRPVGKFIGPWVGMLANIRDPLLGDRRQDLSKLQPKTLERLAVKYSLENMLGFPFVRTAIESGRLTLHGAWFSIAEGQLEWLDWRTGAFAPVQT